MVCLEILAALLKLLDGVDVLADHDPRREIIEVQPDDPVDVPVGPLLPAS